MMLDAVVCGIPCKVNVIRADYSPPNCRADNPDDYYGGYDIEFEICDRKGRPAPWLENKMSRADEDKLIGEILEQLD